jgi:cation:H+ antiporter
MPLANAQDYPIWVNALIFLAATALIWGAGSRLTRYTNGISEQTGMGKALVGMLFLGVITSLPEVANAITASLIDNPALAINNLLGSAAINVLLLAVADAVIGRDALTSVVAKPSTMMMATLSMLVLIGVGMAITTGDVPVLGVGMWGLVLCAMSIGGFWVSAGYNERAPWTVNGTGSKPVAKGGSQDPQFPLRSLVVRTVLAGAVIFTAGYALSQTGDALAEQTGLGTGMVGFALLGLATSMPELSTIITALRIRQYEMAFGQVLGTNFVNLSLILLADAVFAGGPVINEVGAFETVSALLGATLTGVFLVGLLERRDATVMRMGYDSLTVMLLFGGGLVLLYVVQ